MDFPKIFSGVRVLDFSRLLPGPFCSELLIKMGAEVRCVVPPVSDPLLSEYSPFETMRRGKRFHQKNLKDPRDLQEVLTWVKDSDIVLEGFRPGAMGRLGMGFEEVKKINGRILYVSIAGYAPGDPKYLRGAHDLNFLIDSGIYSLMYEETETTIPLLQLADVFGGFYAAFRILSAWITRKNNNAAQHLQVSIVEGLKLLPEYLRDPQIGEWVPTLTGSAARYHIYRTKDEKRVFVGAIEGKFFSNLLQVLGLDYGPQEEGPEVVKAIQEKFSKKTLAQWRDLFAEADACISFIPSRRDVLGH